MHSEEKARLEIDKKLEEVGYVIQDYSQLNIRASKGVIVREFPTSTGPVDYLIFINGQAVGVIEAKAEDKGIDLVTKTETQSNRYANSQFKNVPTANIRFVYEATNQIVRFTDYEDEDYRSREIFDFHTPDELEILLKAGSTLRNRLKHDFPMLDTHGFRDCQIKAVNNLEKSFSDNKPKALIQMATGAGKTYTAITSIYRLLKFCGARRILFLVDTRNLGKQAMDEFTAYKPSDSTKTFTELYNVQLLKSSYIAPSTNVVICTIQRLYSILCGEELDPSLEDDPLTDNIKQPKEVVFNEKYPVGFFDFAFIDECHRSIYNLWKQVLDYFDFFQIGLTATPDKRTFAYFNQNVVSEYPREQAIIDGVNVGEDKYMINTKITTHGGVIYKTEHLVEVRERLTRKERWESIDEDINYEAEQLDKDIVNPSQIRTIIKAFKEAVETTVYPERKELPKTLIFAKSDSHADDIIKIVREEFGKGNEFCRKITYKSENNPNDEINAFRNDYKFRVAVTVDLVATGTDIKPLECLLFMRDVRSKNYFEQMVGRGTRTISLDDLRKVSPSAATNKDHFVIFDAVGVTKSPKTEGRTLDRKPNVPLKDLLNSIALGMKDEDILTTVAGRLTRLNQVLDDDEKAKLTEIAGGKTIKDVVEDLLNPFDLDYLREYAEIHQGKKTPTSDELGVIQKQLVEEATEVFSKPEFRQQLLTSKTSHDQVIDTVNADSIEYSGWSESYRDDAIKTITAFRDFIEANKNEIEALDIIYNQKYKNKALTYQMIRELYNKMCMPPNNFTPVKMWGCYYAKDPTKVHKSEVNQLMDIISVIRFELGQVPELTSFKSRVNLAFKEWIFRRNSTQGFIFSDEQTKWLQMIREHIITSARCEVEDLDFSPFDQKGGRGRFYELFKPEWLNILNELNTTLVSA